MRRILILGSGGAGKSQLAVQLGVCLDIPVIHLDAEYWSAGWVPAESATWKSHIESLVERPAWIMDGNYGGTIDRRLAGCDTVVFLDLPRWLCCLRVFKRWWRYRGRARPDMTPGCPERLDAEFLLWIWTYPAKRRPAVLQQIEAVSDKVRVVHLRSAGEVAGFVTSCGC